MSYSRRSRYSLSRSPYGRDVRSVSRSLSRSRSRSHDSSDVENPGNNLYVTGLSPRTTKKELEKHFLAEGEVVDIHLVVDPWTRESRGFGFVTMATVEEAGRCIKYLDRTVLEGRVITVEKARRRRGRTPTPGRYLGWKTTRVRRRSPSYSPYRRSHYSSSRYSSDRERSYSPYYSRGRSTSRSRTPYSRSPVGRWDHSYSLYYSKSYRQRRSYSPDDSSDCSVSPYYYRWRDRSVSRNVSPRPWRSSRRRSYSRSVSPMPRRRRSYSRSVSPMPRRRRSYSRSVSPRSWRRSYSRRVSSRPRSSTRSYSRTLSPAPRRSMRSVSRSASPRRSYSYGSYSRSRSVSSRSVSESRSPTPRSASPSS